MFNRIINKKIALLVEITDTQRKTIDSQSKRLDSQTKSIRILSKQVFVDEDRIRELEKKFIN